MRQSFYEQDAAAEVSPSSRSTLPAMNRRDPATRTRLYDHVQLDEVIAALIKALADDEYLLRMERCQFGAGGNT